MKIRDFFKGKKGMIPLTNRVQYANTAFALEWIKDNYEGYIKDGFAMNSDLYSVISYLNELTPNIEIKIVNKQTGDEADQTQEGRELMTLLNNPMPGYTYAEWLKQVLGFRWLTGNAFIWSTFLTEGVNKNKTIELQFLPTQCVNIRRNPDTGKLVYDVTIGTRRRDNIPEEEMCHIRMPQYLYGGDIELYGMSPIKAGVRALTASNEGLTSQVRRFQNQYGDGAVGIKGGEGMTEQQIKSVQASIEKNSGSNKAGSITVVNSDLVYHRFGMSAVDAAVLESLKLGLHTFCRMYNLPPELVDPTVSKTYNNVREAKSAVYTMSVIPAVQQVIDSLNRWLVPHYSQNLEFKLDTSKIPELQKDLVSLVQAFKGVWQMTGNEFRQEILGMDPITDDPDMDMILIPPQLMPPEVTPIQDGKADYRFNR